MRALHNDDDTFIYNQISVLDIAIIDVMTLQRTYLFLLIIWLEDFIQYSHGVISADTDDSDSRVGYSRSNGSDGIKFIYHIRFAPL